MLPKKALVIGATGLVGNELLRKLLDAPEYNQVIVLVRKTTGINNQKLREVIVDFDRLSDYASEMAVDDIFCCLGTTIKKAGSRDVMYRIDVEYPLEVARIGLLQGANHYLLVSSMNANANAKIWYSKMKGELEEKLSSLPYESISIIRPSLLLGERQEFRLGEKVASVLFKVVSPLFVGPLEKVRGIEGKQVAKALYHIAQQKTKGVRVFPSDELLHIERVLKK